MSQQTINLYVSIGGDVDADKEEIEELAYQFTKELRDLDSIASVEPVRAGKLPEGAKGLPIEVGTIMVKIAEVGAISAIINVLGSWLSRDKSRTLKLNIGDKSLELTGLSKIEQQELVHWFQIQTGLKLDC